MPIARLTNVATFDDLLEEIRDFLSLTGDWTIHENLRGATEGGLAGGRELIISNGDVLAGLRSTTTGAGTNRLYLFDGIPPYGSSVNIDALPSNSGVVMTDATYNSVNVPDSKVFSTQFAGPFPTATLFTDDPSTYCHVAIEVSAGRFRHIAFGNMRKFGTWTGGAYYASTYWAQDTNNIDFPSSSNHAVLLDSGAPSGGHQMTFHYEQGAVLWRAPSNGTINGVVRGRARGSMRGGFGRTFRSIQETPFSGLISLHPVTLWALTPTDSPQTARCVGQVKDMAEINMRNLEPGESYFIGSDEWIVFPLTTKKDPALSDNTENCGYYGVAYLVRA